MKLVKFTEKELTHFDVALRLGGYGLCKHHLEEMLQLVFATIRKGGKVSIEDVVKIQYKTKEKYKKDVPSSNGRNTNTSNGSIVFSMEGETPEGLKDIFSAMYAARPKKEQEVKETQVGDKDPIEQD